MAALLLVGTTAEATDNQLSDHHGNGVAKRYNRAQPITFVEGGVKFFVYPEGEIEFKILRNRNRTRQANWGWNSNVHSTPGSQRYHNTYRRPVRYDYYGRLKRVGSNHIFYDRYNRVRSVGTVQMRYNRRGLLHQVGGLHIFYTKHGRIKYFDGSVHYTNCATPQSPYFEQNRTNRHYNDDHIYKNRKRKKRYDDDDDD